MHLIILRSAARAALRPPTCQASLLLLALSHLKGPPTLLLLLLLAPQQVEGPSAPAMQACAHTCTPCLQEELIRLAAAAAEGDCQTPADAPGCMPTWRAGLPTMALLLLLLLLWLTE
jgi:hypothetical protein